MNTLVRTGAAAMMVLLGFQAMAHGEPCVANFGNPPRPETSTFQGNLARYFYAGRACISRGGEVLNLNYPDRTPRVACLLVPPGTSEDSRRPLITFLGGARSSAIREAYTAELDRLGSTVSLSRDPSRRGFILLVIEGRDTEHYYPAPADRGTGWDTWYRNLNRADPAINVDVGAIDRFIAKVEERGIVDPRRKYMMGWSNGAAMSVLYGMNTPGIAATAVYSSPDPYSDQFDPCPQAPFASSTRPLMTIHNRCDIFGICQTGAVGFRQEVTSALLRVPLTTIIIDGAQRPAASCEAACGYDVKSGKSAGARRGALAHASWPHQWNDDFMTFLGGNALPAPRNRR